MQPLVAEDQAYNAIKNKIVTAQLKPGARLVHRKLAKELGMSPIPVVLALRLLERDGLVVNMPGMGAYVRTWNYDEIVDLYHIRASLEGLAAQLCAERATRVDMAKILDTKEAYENALKTKDYETIIEADAQFHLSVVNGAHCDYLEAMVSNLSIVNFSIRMVHYYLEEPQPTFSSEPIWVHTHIVEAIQKKDATAASIAAKEHIEASLQFNLKLFGEKSQAAMDAVAS